MTGEELWESVTRKHIAAMARANWSGSEVMSPPPRYPTSYVWPTEPLQNGFRPLRNPCLPFLDTA